VKTEEQAEPGMRIELDSLSARHPAASTGSPAALRAACAPVAAALRGPLRNLLHYHLGHAKLHTRQVMRDAQKLPGTPSP